MDTLTLREDWRVGLASGYPPCCVLFYCLFAVAGKRIEPCHMIGPRWALWMWRLRARLSPRSDLGYVACPYHGAR